MNYSEVKELLNAGFTHDEIMSMVNQTTPDKTPEKDPDKTPAKDPDKTPAETPAETPEKTPVEKQIEGLTALVTTLYKAVQESNIINSSINTMPGSETGAVDNIIASIIRPERKG